MVRNTSLRGYYLMEGVGRLGCMGVTAGLMGVYAADQAEALVIRRVEPRVERFAYAELGEVTRWRASPRDPRERRTEMGAGYAVGATFALVSWHMYAYRAPSLRKDEQRRLARCLRVLAVGPWRMLEGILQILAPRLLERLLDYTDEREFRPTILSYLSWVRYLWYLGRGRFAGCWGLYVSLLRTKNPPSGRHQVTLLLCLLVFPTYRRAIGVWRVSALLIEAVLLLSSMGPGSGG